MQLNQYKAVFSASWVVALMAIGFGAGVTSTAVWATLAVIAVLPPLVMMRVWTEAPPSMSESIRDARR
jgi:hypothetical protein